MRLSIEVTPEQHQRLKAVAALSGKSIKAYVLERVLPDAQAGDDDTALSQLESFLEPRLKAADGATVHKSVEQIFEETHQAMQKLYVALSFNAAGRGRHTGNCSLYAEEMGQGSIHVLCWKTGKVFQKNCC